MHAAFRQPHIDPEGWWECRLMAGQAKTSRVWPLAAEKDLPRDWVNLALDQDVWRGVVGRC